MDFGKENIKDKSEGTWEGGDVTYLKYYSKPCLRGLP
jgi:hypothetical protein